MRERTAPVAQPAPPPCASVRRGAHEIVWRPTSTLIPYLKNSRTHSPAQVEKIVRSIDTFGFNNPILIDERGEIIAGHGRLAAAQRVGLAEVPTVTLGHLTDAQKRAYVIADNRITDDAGWNDDLLSEEILALRDEDFDLSVLGFDDDEIASFLEDGEDGPKGDPDEVPAVQVTLISALGEVWLMGDHRVIVGDSTDHATVEAVLNGVKPHLMVTDPPYGVEYDPAWRGKAKRAGTGKRLSLGVHATGTVENDDNADWSRAWALFPGDVAYVWHAGIYCGVVAESLTRSGFSIRSQIIWNKNNFAIGRGDFHWKHEPCIYCVRNGKTGHYNGDRTQSTVWDIPKPQRSESGHGTQKPVECMKKPIELNSNPGQAVYEPFLGSGTTLIAAEVTGRICYAVEINPQYVDVAIRRWQQVTGKQATRESDGVTFDVIAAEKGAASNV